MKKVLLLFCILIVSGFMFQVSAQITLAPLGNSIIGDDGQGIGNSLALSADGQYLAVGSPNGPLGAARGTVRVFKLEGDTWVQQGADLTGDSDGILFGDGLSLDSLGTTLAIGARAANASFGDFSNSGTVHVYTLVGNNWILKGAAIDAAAAQENFGDAVKLSNDGDVLAVGAPGANGGGTANGAVRVYEYNGSAWIQRGSDLTGRSDFNVFGAEVALSADGSVVASGAVFNADAGVDAGQARIFDWSGSTWVERDSIVGAAGENFGTSVRLSGSGNRIAVGAEPFFGGYGYVKVFDWNGNAWTQAGSTLTSTYNADGFGRPLALSKDGNFLAAGADAGATGRLQVYNWTGSDWALLADTLKGSVDYNMFGQGLALSDTAKIIAVSAPNQPAGGTDRGEVFVYAESSCEGFAIDLGDDVIACDSVVIDPGAVASSFLWSDNSTNQSITINASATIYVDVVENGCPASDTVEVTINKTPAVDLGPDVIGCDSIMLDAGVTGATYLWNGFATDQQVTVQFSAQYYVDVTKDGCVGMDTINVTVNQTPIVDLGDDVIACDMIVLDAATLGAEQYHWNNQTTNQILEVNSSDTYYVDVTVNGCIGSDTVEVSINSTPLVDLGEDVVECDSLILDAGATGASYAWNTEATDQSITVMTTAAYTVSVTSDGCTGADTINVVINTPPVLELGPTVEVCADAQLVPDVVDGDSYLWNDGSTDMTLITQSSGTYYLDVTRDGCVGSDTVDVIVKGYPIVNLGADTVLCEASLTLDAGNSGADFIWSNGASTQTVDVDGSDQYVVTVTVEGCVTVDTIVAVVMSLELGNDTSLCESTLTLDAGNPLSAYNWSTGASTQTVGVLSTDTVSVTVTLGTCTLSDTIKVAVHDYPEVNLGNDTVLCVGEVMLDAMNEGAVYEWNTSATSQTIFADTSGAYVVTVTENDCSASDEVLVLISGYPEVNLGNDTTVCEDVITLDAGNPEATFLWSNGQTTQTLLVASTDTLMVTVTNFGCYSVDTIGVEIVQADLSRYHSLCLDPLMLDAMVPGAEYLWNSDQTTKTIHIEQQGKYWVEVTKGTCVSSDTITINEYWNQKGETKVSSGVPGAGFGTSVSMPDRYTLAVGERGGDQGGIDRGETTVYRWNGSEWVQKGSQIIGEGVADHSGNAICMPDSNTIAVAASDNDTPQDGVDYGHVRVFSWDGNDWVQKGEDIDGEAEYDYFGNAVSMPDANTIAIGSFGNDADGQQDAGHVRVFDWNGTSWIQRGIDLDGDSAFHNFGISVDMPDVNTLAVGANQHRLDHEAGYVKVFQWDGATWTQKGETFVGDTVHDLFGTDVSMGSANTIIIGASQQRRWMPGYAKIYEWDGSAWQRKGGKLIGLYAKEQFGHAVTMPNDDVVAVGGYNNWYSQAGRARIYLWKDGHWKPQGGVFTGGLYQWFGFSIDMPDHQTMAVGAVYGGEDRNGSVKVFASDCQEMTSVDPISFDADDQMSNTYVIYPNPSGGNFTVEGSGLNTFDRVEVYNVMGQSVARLSSKDTMYEATLSLENQPNGMYLIKVLNGAEQATYQLMLER